MLNLKISKIPRGIKALRDRNKPTLDWAQRIGKEMMDRAIEIRLKEFYIAMDATMASYFGIVIRRGEALVDKNIPAMVILREMVPFWRKAAASKWWIGRTYWNFRADREAGKCLN